MGLLELKVVPELEKAGIARVAEAGGFQKRTGFRHSIGDAQAIDDFADDTFSFRLEFVNGGFAEMVSSRSGILGTGSSVEIYGSQGSLFTPQNHVNPPAHGTVFGGNQGNGNYSIGIGADVFQKYRIDLKYISYFGRYRDNGTAVTTQNGFTTLLKDRDFVSLTFKTTF